MPTYRSKPVEVEAVQVSNILSLHELPPWVEDALLRGFIRVNENSITVGAWKKTLSGYRTDYLIRQWAGDYHIMSEDAFLNRFDLAPSAANSPPPDLADVPQGAGSPSNVR